MSGLSGCSYLSDFVGMDSTSTSTSTAATKYRDTSELEKPPQLEHIALSEDAVALSRDSAVSVISESNKNHKHHRSHKKEEDVSSPKGKEESQSKGLGDVVKLEDNSHLIIDRPFAESWLLVAKGLRISNMEVSDRNLEKGQYYVVFDPDLADIKNGEKPGFLDMLFVDDENPKSRYLLTFYENKRSVKLGVEFLEYFSTGVQGESKLPDKGVAKLVKKLYSALHDDLPVN